MRHRVLLLLCLVVCIGAVVPRAEERGRARDATQQAGGTFRSEINLVEVHAVVTDASGAFVRGLKADDFEIYEDGKLQKPAAFSAIDMPFDPPPTPAGSSQPLEWDVRAATRTFEGRIYVLVLDELHTAFTRSRLVRDAARGFVERYLGVNDLAAVVYTSGRREAGQELTNSRRLLLAAIDRFQGRKLPSAGAEKLAVHLTNETFGDAGEPVRTVEGLQRAESVRDPNEPERQLNARRALGSLRETAAWLADVQGRRKALLFFSEGLDYDIYQPFNKGGDATLLDAQEAVSAAQRANVTVYGVDPRGLSQFSDFMDIGRYSDYPQLPYGTFRGQLNELLLSQESLISLAEQTGGIAIVNKSDVAGGLGRIVLDNSRYYLLGYYSQASNAAGKFLKIEVKVKRPGLQVRARQGHVAASRKAAAKMVEAKAGTSAALATALSKPLPVGDLPLRVLAAPFRGTEKHASVLVAIEIDGHGLMFKKEDERFTDSLEVSIVATDEHARVQGGDRQTLNLQLKPDTRAWVSRNGVRFLSRLDLPPGRYQIRVGAHETGAGASAMVPYDLEVPDYGKTPFAASGVLVTSSTAQAYATANPDPQIKDVLPAPPVATRSFGRDETLTCFVEVYDVATLQAGEIGMDITVRDARDGRIVFSARDRRDDKARDRTVTHGFTTSIPLAELTPSVYILRVHATSPGGAHSVVREVPFAVRGAPAPWN